MNVLTVFAFLGAAGIFLTTILTSTKDPRALLDLHGMLIVFGGTIAATAISFRLDRIVLMFKVFFVRVLKEKKIDYRQVISELMRMAEIYRKQPETFESKVQQLEDPFMKEALTLLNDGLMDEDDMSRVLMNRVNTVYHRYHADAQQFQAMGKFPPAMGLMGAVLGMIALLSSLGQEGAQDNVGPAMAIALIATFYGIALANFLIIPIGEKLMESSSEIKVKNFIIVEGTKLIGRKKSAVIVAEELNSFLLASERIDWKTSMTSSTAKGA